MSSFLRGRDLQLFLLLLLFLLHLSEEVSAGGSLFASPIRHVHIPRRFYTTSVRPSPVTNGRDVFVQNQKGESSMKEEKEEESNNNQKAHKKKKQGSVEEADVVVVGGGLCGSSAAFYLNKEGFDVLVLEKAEEVGGCVCTREENEFLWEEGANSFQPIPPLLSFVKDIGLLDELVLANASLPRYIYWNGNLKKLPSSMGELWSTDLLSRSGKLRLLFGLLGLVGPAREKNESIKSFAIRHFGEEVFYRIVDPFVSGVYAGDPSKLNIDAALPKIKALENRGITRGLLEGALINSFRRPKQPDNERDLPPVPPGSLGSFKHGLQSIPLKVKEILGNKCRTGSNLESIQQCSRGWVSTFRTKSGEKKECISKAILLTTPAHETAKFLDQNDSSTMPMSRSASLMLQDIDYPAISGVYLSYPNNSFRVPLEGFGHLIPRKCNVRSLGSIWASSLFPGRAPEGHCLLLTFIGGALDKEVNVMSKQELVDQVDSDLRKIILKSSAPSPRVVSVKTWPRGIPQYNDEYSRLIHNVSKSVSTIPGVFLGGNYISGVSVGDCIKYGCDLSNNISRYLLQNRSL